MLEFLFTLAVGYALAVLFPVPWLSRWIIDKWALLLTKVNS